LSYNDLRRWRDSNPQPCGYWFVEVSRAFTTPQTFRIFAVPPWLLTLCRPSENTCSLSPRTPVRSVHALSDEKFRKESALTVLSGIEPEAFAAFHTKYP
jgi:hypothetical protein